MRSSKGWCSFLQPRMRPMNSESTRHKGSLRWIFVLLALVVPILVGLQIDFYFRATTDDFPLDWQTGVVHYVPPSSFANRIGLKEGDILIAVDGVPFGEWDEFTMGSYSVEVRRDSQVILLDVSITPFVKVNLQNLLVAVAISLTYWGLGVVALVRRYWQTDAQLFFLLEQFLAIPLLFLLSNPPYWFRPAWMMALSPACFHLAAPVALHHLLTFPMPLGTARQRRQGLTALYGLAFLFLIGRLSSWTPGVRFGAIYPSLELMGAIGVLGYVYFRRANADTRRRLRLIVLGVILSIMPPASYILLSTIMGVSYQIPVWQMGLIFVFAPLSYFYAMARHNLFGIDRLINRTLVYGILSAGVLLLFLGPFLLVYNYIPGDPFAEVLVVAGLTMFIGLSFDWTRRRVQRWVDRLFYGGWYDYPGVVETVGDALARCLERQQLVDVLTRQVPVLMQLREGELWIGVVGHDTQANLPSSAGEAANLSPSVLPAFGESALRIDSGERKADMDGYPLLQFPLSFQGQARAVWTVKARRDGEDFSDVDQRILKTLARHSESALGNVLLVEALRRQLDEIRETQHQLLRSREEERARLARDLHDGPIQDLVGMNLQLGLFLSTVGEKSKSSPMNEELRGMRGEVQGLLSELRQVCTNLRPPVLDTLGLGAALYVLAEEWEAQSGVEVQLDFPADATLRGLPGEVAVNLFRVVQEALANVVRHAQARQVKLSMVWQGGRLALTVQDDGQGFLMPGDPHELTRQGHFGLVGMRERVQLVGGQMMLESIPGKGTTVCVTWQES
jgi:signal transduction histidine kinase